MNELCGILAPAANTTEVYHKLLPTNAYNTVLLDETYFVNKTQTL